jgi:hypothetical protein
VRKSCLVGAIALALIGYPQHLLSQSLSPTNNALEAEMLRFNAPPPPDQDAPSGRSRGGASRGACEKYYESVAALVPVTDGFVWGLTASEHPTFWFHLPETSELPVEFVLQDERDNYIYRTTFTMPAMKSGVVSIPLPPTVPALETGQRYFWTLAVYCDPQSPSNSVFVQGSVGRIALDSQLQRQIEAAPPLDRVAIYADNGIWHDALTTLGREYQQNPNDSAVTTAWTNLLEQAELDTFTSDAIVPCCTSEQMTSDSTPRDR